MKRKTMFIVMIVLFFVLIFGIAQAWGNLSIGGTAGYYSPKFGEINSRYLGNLTDAWGSPMGLELEGNFASGIMVDYDISPNIFIRGEYNKFVSKKSGTWYPEIYSQGTIVYKNEYNLIEKLVAMPIILSGVYKFSSEKSRCSYAGVGVCLFSTKFNESLEIKKYRSGDLVNVIPLHSISDNDKSIGYQALAGMKFKMKDYSLAGEIRYIVAKAEMKKFYTTVDLGGFSMGIVASTNFK
ncbi:hypothetical protein J7K55_07190 [Candidatus Aerophobetes bacterium]|nr:hypothetical protein [Candidatus Aerophobetes bacterium]